MMQKQVSNWFALVVIATGAGLIAGYGIIPKRHHLVEFDKATIEFPLIDLDTFGTQLLKLLNKGSAKVEFVASAECHCTNIVPSKGIIEPGQSLDLEVHYRPKLQAREAMSIERSMIRFEIFDGKNAELQIIPLSAEVLNPFEMDRSQLSISQFGTKPVEFQWSLTLAEDVRDLKVSQFPSFMSQLKFLPNETTGEMRIHGKTKARYEINEPEGTIKFTGTTTSGRSFLSELSAKVLFEEAFRCSPSTIRLQEGKATQLQLKQLDPTSYSCKISSVECDLKDVDVSQVSDLQWDINVDSTNGTSGYVKAEVITFDLEAGRSVISYEYIPIFQTE